MSELSEYLAARAKIDAAVADIAARRADDLACARGCHACCADGLTVLSVEAAAITAHVAEHGLARDPEPPAGGCAFLDADGACTVYAARPVLCRTHGLPIRVGELGSDARPLRVLGEVAVCELNFTEREPAPEDVLDGERLAALLLVVEQRFRARSGLPGAWERVSLRDVLSGLASGLD